MDAKEVRFLPFFYIDFTPKETKLNPGESINGRAKILMVPTVIHFLNQGTYQSEVHTMVYLMGSNTINVIIRSPIDKKEEEQVKLIEGDQQSRFLLLKKAIT